MANKTIVVELKLEDKSAVARLGELEVAIKKDADELRVLRAEITKNGQATKAQVQRVGELTATLTSNRSVSRELRNELGGLTAAGLRFRDKMADATLEAIRQSGVLGQLDARAETLTASLNEQAAAQAKLEAELKQSVAAQQASVVALDRLNTEYKEGKIAEDQYTAANAKLNAELLQSVNDQKALNVELNKSSAEQTQLQTELLKTAQSTEKLDQQLLELTRQLKTGQITTEQFRAGVQSINTQVQQVSGAFSEGITDLKTYALGFVGVEAAVQVAQRVIGNAIDTVVEFDQAITRIKTIGPEFAANIDRISEAARTVGIEFGFAATETAGAIDELGRAGLTVEQILGGGLQTALSLAVSGQISLAAAAEATATGLNQFNLAAEESARVADSLVNGANAAQGGVDQLTQALNQSALAASGLGLDIEDTVGALTTFASAGLIGSDAGTSFRTMLIRLQNPTKESTALLEQYNIQAFDQQGNFVGIASLAEQLQQKLKGLTQEQRSQALAQIFGSDALRAANVLYTEGRAGVEKYTEAVSESGTAVAKSAELQQSLSSKIQQLSAAYDSLVLSIDNGDGTISNAFRRILDGATEALALLRQFNKESGQVEQFGKDIQNAGAAELEKASSVGFNRFGANLDLLKEAFDKSTLGIFKINTELDETAKKYEQVISAVKNTENAEQRLSLAITVRAQSLERVKQLQDEINGGNDGRSIQLELAAAKASVVASQRIIDAEKGVQQAKKDTAKATTDTAVAEQGAAAVTSQTLGALRTELQSLKDARDTIAVTDKAGLKANADAIIAIDARIKAIDGEAKATKELTVEQQKKIDLDREMKALAEQAPTPLEPIPTGQIIRDAQPEVTDDEILARFGLSTNADEVVANTVNGVTQLLEQQRLAELEGIRNFDLERLLLDEAYLTQKTIGQEEYNIRSKKLDQEERDQALAAQQAALGGISNFLGALGTLFEQGTEEFKALATTQALINTYLGAAQVLGTPTTLPEPFATISKIANVAAIIVTGLAQVKKIQGFAEGGKLGASGRVTSSMGHPIKRDNGDNVLVRTKSGHVTLKEDEVILNKVQQHRLRRKYGNDIFAQAGVPGFATGGAVGSITRGLVRGTALVNFRGAPRPSPSTIVHVEQAAEQRAADPIIYTRITELNKVNGRIAQITELSTA